MGNICRQDGIRKSGLASNITPSSQRASCMQIVSSLSLALLFLTQYRFRYLSYYSVEPESYLANANWFEDEAIKILDKVAYSEIKNVCTRLINPV